ncbi:hypothetical protein LZ30DRAFT_256848 [Colletotrichum cereale]|nr:hypothetical protein LZ30DRAFT_256848 [Colletotrichum cereale]
MVVFFCSSFSGQTFKQDCDCCSAAHKPKTMTDFCNHLRSPLTSQLFSTCAQSSGREVKVNGTPVNLKQGPSAMNPTRPRRAPRQIPGIIDVTPGQVRQASHNARKPVRAMETLDRRDIDLLDTLVVHPHGKFELQMVITTYVSGSLGVAE